jgi:hypothetical protein
MALASIPVEGKPERNLQLYRSSFEEPLVNRTHFTPPFLPSALPAWRCPTCKNGALAIVKDSLRKEETSGSKNARTHPDWEPSWIHERFSVLLRCSHCMDPVFAAGDVKTSEEYDSEYGHSFLLDRLEPKYFSPAPPIISVPPQCPKKVSVQIFSSSALFWSSPPSAANGVRIAVELLMDDQRVPRKGKTTTGRFQPLSLHARIERYANKRADVGEALLAIKWLGNSGSHSARLRPTDVLDGFELLENALEEVYDDKSSRLKGITVSINRRKGPR